MSKQRYYVSLQSSPVTSKQIKLHKEVRIQACYPKRAAEAFIMTECPDAIKHKRGTFVVEVRTPTSPSVIKKFNIRTSVRAERNRRK